MLKSYFKEPRFRGIKVSFNYKKGDNYNLFGDVDTSCIFPNADIKIPHTLEQFFEMYKIDAFNYLFNDDCKIVISEYKEKQLNKFEKKEIKKNLLVNKENYKSELVKLW